MVANYYKLNKHVKEKNIFSKDIIYEMKNFRIERNKKKIKKQINRKMKKIKKNLLGFLVRKQEETVSRI